MGKTFNVTADCRPNQHYMVDLTSRLAQIREYVDRGEYFAVNRARQYGKTTTLRALKEYLKDQYYVISMDFQMQMSSAMRMFFHCICQGIYQYFAESCCRYSEKNEKSG